MTRRHFEWAAAELADAHLARTFDRRETHAIKVFLATLFQRFNPRFDWVRFESRVDQLIERAQVQPRLVERARVRS